jgi:hypothetical protein
MDAVAPGVDGGATIGLAVEVGGDRIRRAADRSALVVTRVCSDARRRRVHAHRLDAQASAARRCGWRSRHGWRSARAAGGVSRIVSRPRS